MQVPNQISRTRVITAILGLGLLAAAPILAQAQGRLVGTIVGPDGEGIEGVRITLTATSGRAVEFETTTDANGKFTLSVLDSTLPYRIRVEKEGYQTLEGPAEIALGQVTRSGNWTLKPLPEQGAAGDVSEAVADTFNAGVKAYNAGDLATARAKFEAALQQDPELAQARDILGSIYFEQGEFRAAVATADEILAESPDDIDALRLKFDAASELGELETAGATLDRLVPVGEAQDARRAYNLGVALLREQDREGAMRRFDQAIALDPELASAYVAKATALNGLGRHAEAAAAAERAIQSQPGNLSAHTLRVEAYRELGDEEALAAAEAALNEAAASGDPEQLMRRGEALFNSGEIDKAITVLTRALAADPDLATAHFFLGMAYANQEENASAREHLERFLELEPDSADAATAREILEYME